LPSILYRLTPTGPFAGVGQQLLHIGLDNPIADITIEFLPSFVEQEGGTAFDKIFFLGIEIRAKRRIV
jgi:hypothetical protein